MLGGAVASCCERGMLGVSPRKVALLGGGERLETRVVRPRVQDAASRAEDRRESVPVQVCVSGARERG